MAEAVIGRALLAVGEGLVGLVDFLELDLGLVVARVAVRVILHRELAEGGFQLRLGRRLRDAENLVIVALGHQAPPTSSCIAIMAGFEPGRSRDERTRPCLT